MTYEEKYKQALERARKEWVENLDNCYTNYRERLEIIFPELKESEDEKIREAIHIYLDWLDGRKDYAPKGIYSIKDMIRSFLFVVINLYANKKILNCNTVNAN